MRDLIPVDERAVYRTRDVMALDPEAPSVAELFAFMRDAETRFETLRMRVEERRATALGEQTDTIDVALRPPHAKLVTRRDAAPTSRDFHIWISDGEQVRTYDARANIRTERRLPTRVVGAADPDLPDHSRVYVPRTMLPIGTLVETFVHPHGFCSRVLRSARTRVVGVTRLVEDRVAFLLRADHPRVSHAMTDRPDRWLEVGIDRMTGLILLLVEHVGDRVTRHAEVVDLDLDPPIGDDVFRVHVSHEVAPIY